MKSSALVATLIAASTLALSGCHLIWSSGYTNVTTDGGSSDIEAYDLVTRSRYAQKLNEAGRKDEAIAQYQLHIQERLHDPARPVDENPYFYQILIGDIYLDLNHPDKAEDSYSVAWREKVANTFIIDRMRRLGAWYENHGKLETAREVLKRYRNLDTLLFDFDIDRISKKIVDSENQGIPVE